MRETTAAAPFIVGRRARACSHEGTPWVDGSGHGPCDRSPSMHWGIKPQTNETSRQAGTSQYVPSLWDMGIELPDPALRWDAEQELWHYTEPDWYRLRAIVKGEGTEATRVRLWYRQQLHHHDWIRDILLGSDDGVVTVA